MALVDESGKYMNRIRKKHEYLFIGIFFTILVLGLLILLQTVNSGYHLIDDHEFYSYQDIISKHGLWNAIKINVKGDLAIRYRPLYIVMRTIGVAILGTNTIAWSICKAIEIIITLQLLYVFARKKINTLFSLIFAVLIMWGYQSEIWWRLGPQESFGMLLFATVLLLTYNLKTANVWHNKVLFVFFIACLSIQKESFWVSVPWFLILLFAYECEENNDNRFQILLINFFKKHLLESMIVGIIFFVDMYMIVFWVGTDKVSYAGFSSDLNWKFYVWQILKNMAGECFPYLMALAIAILISYIGYKKSLVDISFILQIFACAYLCGAELIVYAKSGMESRYLLPWCISIFYIIYILGYSFWLENLRIQIAIGTLSLLFMLILTKNVISEGMKFAEKGRNLEECVTYIINNTAETDKIVAVSRDREVDHAMGVLMKLQYHYENFETIDIYEEDLSLLENVDILFGKKGQVYYRLSEEAGLTIDNYNFFETNNYEVAIKK